MIFCRTSKGLMIHDAGKWRPATALEKHTYWQWRSSLVHAPNPLADRHTERKNIHGKQ